MLDKRFIDELRQRLNLSDIIGRRIKIARSGREFKACCPFHNEKTPSFYINDEKGFFHCFGCGAHGDIVSFRMRHDNVSFMEAVETLASEAGLQVPKADPRASEKYDERQRLYDIMERVAKWYQKQLHHPQNGFALRYLHDRGVTEAMIDQFRLGYAPNNWDALREDMIAEGITRADLIDLGVLRHSSREDKADKPYSFFRGRIMFPVTDPQGRVIAFGGRHLDAAFEGQNLKEKPPKYINSSENPLFHKSSVLYGLARARAQIKEGSPLILVEGYMDVIALAQVGFATAVAPLGTSLTEEHMQLAWKISPPETAPLLCFDGDKAGQNAAYRALERLVPHFTAQRSVRLVFMPAGEDPDSLIRKDGAKALHAVLEQSSGVFDTLWQKEIAQTGTSPEGRAALQARMEAHIRSLADPLLQNSYRQSLRDRLYQLNRTTQTSARQSSAQRAGGFIKSGLGGGFGKFGNQNKGKAPQPTIPIQKPSFALNKRRWQVLLATAINHPFLLEQSLEEFGSLNIPDPEMDRLREALVDLVHGHMNAPQMMHESHTAQPLTSEKIKQSLSERGLNDIVTHLLDESIYQHSGFARPGVAADTVLEGWKDVWIFLQREAVLHDKNKLRQAVKHDTTDETANQLYALSQQEQHLLDDTFSE